MQLLHSNMSTIVTPIQQIDFSLNGNTFYVKREDLHPFSFGGNKARKAMNFFRNIIPNGYDAVVTYGSGSSNHCRVVANACARYGLKCWIVSPEEEYVETYNSRLVQMFGAHIIKTPLESVSSTIDDLMQRLSKECKPYFIPGGGHGNIGTHAYVEAYQEIVDYEQAYGVYFDYIFLASGTGTTQAGLVCGSALHKDDRHIVGISIARSNPHGGQVVQQSVEDYLASVRYDEEIPAVVFDDSYTCGGYGVFNNQIRECVDQMIRQEGIPFNRTYSGKAFWGMKEYIHSHKIHNQRVLFLHTGGSPLFFDDMGESQ